MANTKPKSSKTSRSRKAGRQNSDSNRGGNAAAREGRETGGMRNSTMESRSSSPARKRSSGL